MHVENLVRKASKRVMEIYDTDFEVIHKTDGSPITVADIAVHDILMKGLSTYGWPIISEESEAQGGYVDAKKVWIIDPIDGTGGFVKKSGEFAIQVALVEDSKPIFGAVYQPVYDRYYFAQKGKGSFMIDEKKNKRKLTTSHVSNIEDAILAVSANHFDEEVKKKVTELGIDNYFHIGGIGNKIALIVERKADVYATMTDTLGEWDICAPQIILEEAGGVMTGLRGEKLTYNNNNPRNPYGVLAGSKNIHTLLLKKIKEHL